MARWALWGWGGKWLLPGLCMPRLNCCVQASRTHFCAHLSLRVFLRPWPMCVLRTGGGHRQAQACPTVGLGVQPPAPSPVAGSVHFLS